MNKNEADKIIASVAYNCNLSAPDMKSLKTILYGQVTADPQPGEYVRLDDVNQCIDNCAVKLPPWLSENISELPTHTIPEKSEPEA